MHIEQLDFASAPDSTLRAWYTLFADAARDWAPCGIVPPFDQVLVERRHPGEITAWTAWVAWEEHRAVGAIDVTAPLTDNLHRMDVHPQVPGMQWRDEVVHALFATAVDIAATQDRRTIGLEVCSGSGLRPYVERYGARLGSVEQHNVVRLADVDVADLKQVLADAPGKAPDYELVVVDGPFPDDVAAGVAHVVEAMNTAPKDDLEIDDITVDVGRLRSHERKLRARGTDRWTVCARHRATGEFVALTELLHFAHHPAVVEQGDTVVIPGHRGHGLGLWIKAANLLRLVEERPETVCVETWNAASNDPMLGINRRLGFRPEHEWEIWEVDRSVLAAALGG